MAGEVGLDTRPMTAETQMGAMPPRYKMDPEEKRLLDEEIQRINWETFVKDKENGRIPKQSLGKEDFLQLLMKQLAYQDPMAPMEDKEFIAQMAQFSSLEQMTAMSQGFTKLSSDFTRITNLLSSAGALNALSKSVEIADGDRIIQGTVNAVTREENPRILVNGAYYSWDNVQKVFEE